jgi:hypothetical protein
MVRSHLGDGVNRLLERAGNALERGSAVHAARRNRSEPRT